MIYDEVCESPKTIWGQDWISLRNVKTRKDITLPISTVSLTRAACYTPRSKIVSLLHVWLSCVFSPVTLESFAHMPKIASHAANKKREKMAVKRTSADYQPWRRRLITVPTPPPPHPRTHTKRTNLHQMGLTLLPLSSVQVALNSHPTGHLLTFGLLPSRWLTARSWFRHCPFVQN